MERKKSNMKLEYAKDNLTQVPWQMYLPACEKLRIPDRKQVRK